MTSTHVLASSLKIFRHVAASFAATLTLLSWAILTATPSLGASFVVNIGTTDLGDNNLAAAGCDDGTGHCSLRAAIQQGNALSGTHTITFSVTTVNVINGGLPALAAPFTIVGTGVTINGNGHGCLSLTDSGTPALGHTTGATGSTISNLTIGNCSGDGISANGHSYTFTGNHIGIDVTGLVAMPNTGHGISLSASQVYPDTSTNFFANLYNSFPVQPVDATADLNAFNSNMATALASLNPVIISGNVISGNGGNGIEIFSQNLAAVLVSNNMIGTDITGNVARPNGGAGVHMTGSTFGNLIGPGNVISGNIGDGVSIESGAVFLPNTVLGNRIGLAATAVGLHIGNGANGVKTDTKPSTDPLKFNPSKIGAFIGPANLISDNKGGSNSALPDTLGTDFAGIVITGASTGIKVVGNTIGLAEFPPTTPLASKLYGNAGDGIIVTTSGNTISGNNIAANARHGIVLQGSGTTANSILGNSIGTHAGIAGNLTLGNGFDGIHVDGASSTTVGGPGATDVNVIAGNGRNGLKIRHGGTSNGWSNMSQRNAVYGNGGLTAGIGIDLDRQENAVDAQQSEFPPNYANLDQSAPIICAGPADTGACSGSAAPASTGGNTTLDWTLTSHGPANFRMEFFKINAATNNAATSMTFLGEQLVTTDLSGMPSNSASCSAGRCSVTLAASSGGSYVLMTATDITPLTDQPGVPGDWKAGLKCFIGNLGIILSSCNTNNTSEFSNVLSVPLSPPAATTVAASAITTVTATVNGTVSANGSATVVTFDYGTTIAYGSTASATQSPLPSSAVGSAVSAPLTALTCNTTYHFRVNANNGVGSTVNGADLTFTTAACAAVAPTAISVAATALTATTATLNGTVSANGASTTVTFDYGTTIAYGGAGSPLTATQSPLSSGSVSAPVSALLSGLTCNTTYHFRVKANNGVGGTINGGDMSFTTAVCAPIAPTATTAAATSITTTTATLNGSVSANGAVTAATFDFGLSAPAYGGLGSPANAAQSPLSSGSINAPVSLTLTGLTCNTTYHFRANANNGVGGTVNGSDQSFITAACPPGAPSATTNGATAITVTSATVNGTVSSNGAATTVTFEYGTTVAYGSTVNATQSPLGSGAVNTTVSAPLSGLTCGTTYHFRVKANNGATTNGNDANFTTALCPAPTVATSAATALAVTGATLNGLVSANGAATSVTFEYGTTVAYGSSIAAVQSPLISSAVNAAVSAPLTGLTCNTTYHFRVTANNGTNSNGGDLSFSTSACPAAAPTVATSAATAITTVAATLNGTASANGAVTTITFDYGTTVAYGSSVNATQSPLAIGSVNSAVSAPLTGLVCNTTYHYRANANNGIGGTINGSDISFTTAACAAVAPTVTTVAASALTTTTATVNGTVSANGASTTVTFDYGTTIAYGGAGSPLTATQSPLSSGSVSAPVSALLSGLTCNTTYHFRVNANNGVGSTVNGADLTFTTAACAAVAPTAITIAASALTATTATLNGTVTANGATTTVTFDYGTTIAYGGAGSPLSATQSPLSSGSVSAPVSALLSGLTCNTTYHFRVNANNGVGGTINGSDLSFTTAACAAVAPTATTAAATSITMTTATLNGTLSANGTATTVTFEYGATVAYGSTINAAQSPLASGAVNTAVSAAVSGLTCGTTYHFRVKANNGLTTNGSDLAFSTAACPVPVTSFSGNTFTGTGTATATLSGSGANCSFGTTAFVGPPVAAPPGVTFPDGLFDFTTSGCTGTITVTVKFPTPFPANAQYWKYGPTPGPVAAHWYTLGATNNLVLSGSTATFTIADGGLGDDDLAVNGSIVDQGGPGVAAVVPAAEVVVVPTLSQSGLALLCLLMMLAGFGARQFRSPRASIGKRQ